MPVVTYQLRQRTSIQDGPLLYRVNNDVESAVGSSPAIFVYKTETKKFDHYATVADLERWPDTYDVAVTTGTAFYRSTGVQRDWATVAEMNLDLDATRARVQRLADDLAAVQGAAVIDRILTINGEA